MKLLIDFSTLNAVESIFRKGPVDPWAHKLVGRFADAYAYASRIEIPWPTHHEYNRGGILPPGSALENKLHKYEPALTVAKIYRTDDLIAIRPEYTAEVVRNYLSWARLNLKTLRTWSLLHRESWIAEPHKRRVLHGTVYKMEHNQELAAFDQELAVGDGASEYAYDVILRYPFYGKLTPNGGYYLNHPLRDAVLLPGVSRETARPPIGLSFDSSVRLIAPHLDLESYVELLQELRNVVDELKLKTIVSGQVNRDIVRALAAKLRFPPRLRNQEKLLSAAIALIGGIGAAPALGPAAAISGAAIGLATTFWEGQLPRSLNKITWLRWAFHWDIENQIIAPE